MRPVADDNASRVSFRTFEASAPQCYPAEMHGLIEAVRVVNRRCFTNRFLRTTMRWAGWVLGTLLVAAAFSPLLRAVVISAGLLMVVMGLVTFLRMWRRRPSNYEAARELDEAAGLADRMSTALYFGAVRNPNEMILHQRRDALARLAHVHPQILFPFRLPPKTGRVALLALVAGVILALRVHSGPPVTALILRAARSNIAHALQPSLADIQKDILALTQRPAALPDATEVADLKPAEDLSKDRASDASPATAKVPSSQSLEGQQDANQAESDQKNPAATQQGQRSENAAHQDASGKSQDAKGSEQQGASGDQQSLTEKVLQSLKSLLADATGKQPLRSPDPNSSNQQPASNSNPQPAANSPQNANQQNKPDGKASGQSQSPQDRSQETVQDPGVGIGDSPRKQQQSAPVDRPFAGSLAPDRVALESNQFREQGHVRLGAEPGTAEVPFRNISPQPVATTNGAEQENIPLRYRFYLQRYFDQGHAKVSP